MKMTSQVLQKEIEEREEKKIEVQKEIDRYEMGLIGKAQFVTQKKFRAKLNKEIKDLKRQLELNA